MPQDIGVIFPPWQPPSRLLPTARAVEAAGIGQLWMWEDCFFESGLVSAAACLARTSTLSVRVGLMPVPLRNVALAAMEVATLDRLFPGRFQHVVGHGVQAWMAQVGAKAESPLTLLREYVEALDALLAGDEVTVQGRYVRLEGVRLAYPPGPGFSTWAGGVGERTLAMLGEIASGVLVDSGTSPSRLRRIVELIGESGERVGRLDRPVLPVYAHVFRGDDARAQYERVFGPVPSDSDDVQGLVGSAEDVADGARRLFAAGAATVVMRPLEHDGDLDGFVRFVADDVLPLLG